MTDDELVALVRQGVVPPEFYTRYEKRARATRADAGDVVADLLGAAGTRLARRARAAAPCEPPDRLLRMVAEMNAEARERFARDVLRFRS